MCYLGSLVGVMCGRILGLSALLLCFAFIPQPMQNDETDLNNLDY